ncbi:MAG: DMT family transporter [Nitrospinota bacterium]|nr:MAG: DMT family transporter [Nitrospinota bacterium]
MVEWIGAASGLGCALIWACDSIMLKTQMTKLDALMLNLIRCCFASLFFLLLLPLFGQVDRLFTTPPLSLFLLLLSVFFSLAIGDTLYYQSMALLGVSKSLPLSSTYPLFTLLLATLFLEEPFTWRLGVGAVLVIAGIYPLSIPPRALPSSPALLPSALHRKGVLFALLASLCWSLSIILLKVSLLDLDTITANALRMPAATCILALLASLSQKKDPYLRVYDKRLFLILALSGALSTGIGSLLYLTALRYAGAAKAAIFSATSPLFGAPLSLLILKEELTWPIVLGILLTVLGIWLVL